VNVDLKTQDETAQAGQDRATTRRILLLMSIASPELAGLAVRAGYDGIVLDVEHGFPVGRDMQTVQMAVHAAGGRCLARVSPSQLSDIAAWADQGLDGVLLSNAESIADIDAVSRLMSFPPSGARSVNPFVAAAGNPGDADNLFDSSPEIWVMGETLELLDALEKAGNEWSRLSRLTGIIAGPYDLAARLGGSGGHGPDHVELRECIQRFAAQAARSNLEFGLFVRTPLTLDEWKVVGIDPDVVIAGYDSDIWFTRCRELLQSIHECH
jgi:4-hydroxy-2-oxoheptanedioate aldolase